jgi:hypothetical protein
MVRCRMIRWLAQAGRHAPSAIAWSSLFVRRLLAIRFRILIRSLPGSLALLGIRGLGSVMMLEAIQFLHVLVFQVQQ